MRLNEEKLVLRIRRHEGCGEKELALGAVNGSGADKRTLHCHAWQALKAVGRLLTIHFSPFRRSEGLTQA